MPSELEKTMGKLRFKPLLMWLMPLSFFAYQFILRQWPSLTMTTLMQQFQMDAGDFGFFSAAYYLGYAGMQIPAALLLNRFKPNLLISLFIALAAGSCAWLLYTDSWSVAVCARFLIGSASAMGFLGTTHVISHWFKPQHYGRMVGLSFSFGLMGAIYGGRPVSILIDDFGMQSTGLMIVLGGLFLALIIFVFLKSPPDQGPLKNQGSFDSQALKALFKNKFLILLSLSNLLLVGALEGFADVWGVNFLTLAYDLTKTDAAGIISFIFLGMLIGGPLLGLAAERLGAFQVISLAGVLMALLLGILLFSCPWLDTLALQAILFMVGIFCCYQVIVFSACQHLVPPQHLGIAVAFLNGINMLGGSFFHTMIGQTATYFWDGVLQNSCPYYSPQILSFSLSVIPIASVIGSGLMVILIKNSSLK